MTKISERLADLSEESAVLIALYDQNDRLRYANVAFRSTYALEPEETPLWADLMRRNTKAGKGTIIKATDFETWLVSAQSRRGKLPFRAFETDVADGRWFWMTETVQGDGWMLCIASDITPMKTSERDLRQDRDFALRASRTDELTSISNRRFMMAALESMVVRQASAEPVSGCTCIMDLDYFKRINDVYGHQAGDGVLIDFARRVQPLVRRRDSFGRIGGEEFMLILPDTTLGQGELIVDRILKAVRGARPIRSAPTFSYTCSAGLAELRRGETARELYARADEALYHAKQSGRDRLKIVA
ncbi:sensor domain-containing diguanylate cyclase [Rhizobium binxianense]|uniref:sensor domain-containing diguanylate cyclase n=1 Tax=Rhizobium binxianense TaxID=3024242 RepID=UPI00234E7676|nr:sensor domain-containing diguanylate cyclase [Rhizobium sp. BC56]MDC7745115.1 sensor domain-containing diguanylate cyclase [Rhizobium sp. BC56]